MRVLIVGAGIAGLTLAALLRQRGLEPMVVEKRTGNRKAGYMLGLWPLGSRVLKGLGLYDEFEQISIPLKRFSLGNSLGQVLQTYPLEYLDKEYGLIRLIKRSALVELLTEPVMDLIYTGLAVESIQQEGGIVKVGFSDNSTESFDLVVGCDGIHSQVRKLTFGNADAIPIGWTGWGAWIDAASVRNDTMVEYWEMGKSFCAVVPSKDTCCTFIGMPSLKGDDGGNLGLDRVYDYFSSKGGLITQLLGPLSSAEDVFKTEFHTLSLDTWHKGRVALLGDASSAYFPFGGLGIGASMAMESAAVLCDELSRTDKDSLRIALSFYEQRRRPRVGVFEQASRVVIDNILHYSGNSTDQEPIINQQRKMFKIYIDILESPL